MPANDYTHGIEHKFDPNPMVCAICGMRYTQFKLSRFRSMCPILTYDDQLEWERLVREGKAEE